MMHSLPEGYRALIIGSSGTIGSAFLEILQADPRCGEALGIHRHSSPAIDYADEATIAAAADSLQASGPFHLIINTIGVLHTEAWSPEKKLADVSYGQLESLFQINAFGPALTLAKFSTLLAKEGAIMAVISAKVGSIEDNRLGGWYSYRASKAALNMLTKTAAIELRRTQANTKLIALHPGTVVSRLSKPFKGEQIGRPAIDAARDMLAVLNQLPLSDSGSFYSYSGEKLPW
jgi:NAD(P)-dependent dehydrogenase (short-subunit alcohol dehydrogenase family)